MKVTWEVEDGYAGKSAPQYLEIPDEDLVGYEENEIEIYIEECVQDDFEQRISFTITKVEE